MAPTRMTSCHPDSAFLSARVARATVSQRVGVRSALASSLPSAFGRALSPSHHGDGRNHPVGRKSSNRLRYDRGQQSTRVMINVPHTTAETTSLRASAQLRLITTLHARTRRAVTSTSCPDRDLDADGSRAAVMFIDHGQQNAHRCESPRVNPGRSGPWQSVMSGSLLISESDFFSESNDCKGNIPYLGLLETGGESPVGDRHSTSSLCEISR